MSTDLALLPVHALAAKLKSRSVSPVDLKSTFRGFLFGEGRR
jgi:hypothetical protein